MQDEKQVITTAKEEEDHVSKKLNKWKIAAGIAVLLLSLFTGIFQKIGDAISGRIQGEVAKAEDAQRVVRALAQQEAIIAELKKAQDKIIDLQQQVTLLQKQAVIDQQQAVLAGKRMDLIQTENDLGKEERLIIRGQIVQIEKSDTVQTQIITSTLGRMVK